MNDSYIKESIDKVKQYLDKVDRKNKLNGEFDKYYSERVKDIKVSDLNKENWYKELSEKVKGILDGSELYNYSTKDVYDDVLVSWKSEYGRFVVGYEGCFNIKYPSILAQLCKIYKVKIDNEICAKLGDGLNGQLNISASAVINDGKLIFGANSTMEKKWQDESDVAHGLKTKCEGLLTELRKKIAEKHKGKFDFFELSPNNTKNWKWDDAEVCNLVSQLDEFKLNAKCMFSDEFKKNNKADDFDTELKQPAPLLYELLKDEKLETYINEYKKKSLEERKKDPLRQVFRLNGSTSSRKLNDIIQKQTIQQWFESLMKRTPTGNRGDIYFVLLELFGKDFEFGGYQYKNNGKTETIPKAKLWDQVNKKAVKAWYKKNKIQTDLLDDSQIEEKIAITGEQKDNNIGITAEKNKKENRTEKKQSETSKTGYTIGLGLDILVTAIFAILAIKISSLFLISLVITGPLAIFFVFKLGQGCLSFGNKKIEVYNCGPEGNYFYSETREPEKGANQDKGLEP